MNNDEARLFISLMMEGYKKEKNKTGYILPMILFLKILLQLIMIL